VVFIITSPDINNNAVVLRLVWKRVELSADGGYPQ